VRLLVVEIDAATEVQLHSKVQEQADFDVWCPQGVGELCLMGVDGPFRPFEFYNQTIGAFRRYTSAGL
jgi:hypothetical protein